jgi:hypothetical protein
VTKEQSFDLIRRITDTHDTNRESSEILMSHDETITIRTSRAADAGELVRLAALDSARPIEGVALVAEVNGRVRAALPLDGAPAVADPFAETDHVVALLQAHAAALDAEPRSETRGARVRARVRSRFALAA